MWAFIFRHYSDTTIPTTPFRQSFFRQNHSDKVIPTKCFRQSYSDKVVPTKLFRQSNSDKVVATKLFRQRRSDKVIPTTLFRQSYANTAIPTQLLRQLFRQSYSTAAARAVGATFQASRALSAARRLRGAQIPTQARRGGFELHKCSGGVGVAVGTAMAVAGVCAGYAPCSARGCIDR